MTAPCSSSLLSFARVRLGPDRHMAPASDSSYAYDYSDIPRALLTATCRKHCTLRTSDVIRHRLDAYARMYFAQQGKPRTPRHEPALSFCNRRRTCDHLSPHFTWADRGEDSRTVGFSADALYCQFLPSMPRCYYPSSPSVRPPDRPPSLSLSICSSRMSATTILPQILPPGLRSAGLFTSEIPNSFIWNGSFSHSPTHTSMCPWARFPKHNCASSISQCVMLTDHICVYSPPSSTMSSLRSMEIS